LENHDAVTNGRTLSTTEITQSRDEAAFSELVERYRRELQVHCYRMLGSFEDSEDLVQETFLRAWRSRESFEGRSTFRAWLYRIATNACLDALQRKPRRLLPRSWGRRPTHLCPCCPRSTCPGYSPTGSGGRGQGDDRARFPVGDPAAAAATAGGTDPA
jgi:DNA-directed RNA polymerase specialized sigma24 family protein